MTNIALIINPHFSLFRLPWGFFISPVPCYWIFAYLKIQLPFGTINRGPIGKKDNDYQSG